MYCVKRWLIWIYRWRHCRGFGVQSPTDYSFIRYVINEHYPYYAYKDLAEKFPHLNHILRKKAELLFRVANYIQSSSALILSEYDVYKYYITSGCRKTSVGYEFNYGCQDDRNLIVVSVSFISEDMLKEVVSHLQYGQILVIDDIDTRCGRRLWKDIINNDRTTITFDLYYIGIVMNVVNRYKHDYVVNF